MHWNVSIGLKLFGYAVKNHKHIRPG